MGYWDGYQQGVSSAQQLARQGYDLDALQQQSDERALAIQNAQLDTREKTRQLGVAAGMRDAAAKARPVTTTTIGAPAADTSSLPGPIPGSVAALPTSTYSNLQSLTGATRTQAYDPSKSIGDNDLPPGQTTIPQAQYDAQTAQANALQGQQAAVAPAPLAYPADNQPAPLTGAAAGYQPGSTTTSTTTPANPLKAQIEYLNSIGETQKAQDMVDSLMGHANKVMTITGNPNDALKIVNDATGQNLAYSPLASLDAITSDGQLVGYIDKNKYKELTTAGAQPMDAMKGAMIPLDLGGGGKAVMDYLSKHPDATDAELAGVGEKAGVPLSKMIPLLAERQKVQAQKESDDRQLKSQQFQAEQQARSQAFQAGQHDKTIAAIVGRQNVVIPNAFDANGNPIIVNRATGTVMQTNNPTGVNVAAARSNTVQNQSEARQRGGAQTANIAAAHQMYQQEAPELIALHNKVLAKGTLPAGGFKDINALNMWLDSKQSDPDTVLLQKKTKFLSDSLMKTLGGSQGGEWAFKLASDILDPTLAGPAFANVVNSHEQAMARVVGARRSFGQDQPAAATGQPLKIGKYSVVVH